MEKLLVFGDTEKANNLASAIRDLSPLQVETEVVNGKVYHTVLFSVDTKNRFNGFDASATGMAATAQMRQTDKFARAIEEATSAHVYFEFDSSRERAGVVQYSVIYRAT